MIHLPDALVREAYRRHAEEAETIASISKWVGVASPTLTSRFQKLGLTYPIRDSQRARHGAGLRTRVIVACLRDGARTTDVAKAFGVKMAHVSMLRTRHGIGPASEKCARPWLETALRHRRGGLSLEEIGRLVGVPVDTISSAMQKNRVEAPRGIHLSDQTKAILRYCHAGQSVAWIADELGVPRTAVTTKKYLYLHKYLPGDLL